MGKTGKDRETGTGKRRHVTVRSPAEQQDDLQEYPDGVISVSLDPDADALQDFASDSPTVPASYATVPQEDDMIACPGFSHCNRCGHEWDSEADMVFHMKNAHSCFTDGEVDALVTELRPHLVRCVGKGDHCGSSQNMLLCTKCGRKCLSGRLRLHVIRFHLPTPHRPYPCDHCSLLFPEAYALVQHRRRNHATAMACVGSKSSRCSDGHIRNTCSNAVANRSLQTPVQPVNHENQDGLINVSLDAHADLLQEFVSNTPAVPVSHVMLAESVMQEDMIVEDSDDDAAGPAVVVTAADLAPLTRNSLQSTLAKRCKLCHLDGVQDLRTHYLDRHAVAEDVLPILFLM